jgi:hypothetical protein
MAAVRRKADFYHELPRRLLGPATVARRSGALPHATAACRPHYRGRKRGTEIADLDRSTGDLAEVCSRHRAEPSDAYSVADPASSPCRRPRERTVSLLRPRDGTDLPRFSASRYPLSRVPLQIEHPRRQKSQTRLTRLIRRAQPLICWFRRSSAEAATVLLAQPRFSLPPRPGRTGQSSPCDEPEGAARDPPEGSP